MDKETLVKYAPWLVIAFVFFMQYKVFVTPVELEQTHRTILQEVAEEYTTKIEQQAMQKQYDNITIKIDKIYDYIMRK